MGVVHVPADLTRGNARSFHDQDRRPLTVVVVALDVLVPHMPVDRVVALEEEQGMQDEPDVALLLAGVDLETVEAGRHAA